MSDAPCEVVLDLSRLLSRMRQPTPTGVDRCELAYARGLLATIPDHLHFSAVYPTGFYGRLNRAAALHFLDVIQTRWAEGLSNRGKASALWAVAQGLALRPLSTPPPPRSGRIYVQSSPHHLDKPRLVEAILRRERARFVVLVHDLIPIEYPEYARPSNSAEHHRRIGTIVDHAAGIIVNSSATLRSLQPFIEKSCRTPLTAVAHLGIYHGSGHEHEKAGVALAAAAEDRPFFVVLSTIEPRKNHLLLLNIWRRLAENLGTTAVPKLVLIGRRGWENEQIIDMLDRCPSLKGCVEEHNGLPDRVVRGLLRRARALLMPSFAEGYGMPVSEALSIGVPVICSDLPALREAGGCVPQFLDPLDGAKWIDAILDYASPASAMRHAQLARLKQWSAPTWDRHLAIVLDLLHRLPR